MAYLERRRPKDDPGAQTRTDRDGDDDGAEPTSWTETRMPFPSSTPTASESDDDRPTSFPGLFPSSSLTSSDSKTVTTPAAQQTFQTTTFATQTSGGALSTISDPNNKHASTSSADSNGGSSSFDKGPLIAAILIPIVLVAILGAAIFIYLRRRRNQSTQAFIMQEAKVPKPPEPKPPIVGEGFYSPSSYPSVQPSVMPATVPAVMIPHHQPQVQEHRVQEHPIIISPISASTNHAYYTGLDTSDIMSVTSTNARTTHMDEPPPPYRPRSIAMAMSRDPYFRHPPQARMLTTKESGGSSGTNRNRPSRSPFADPQEDDAASEVSGTGRGVSRPREDEISEVSDLSYQDESSDEYPPRRR